MRTDPVFAGGYMHVVCYLAVSDDGLWFELLVNLYVTHA